MRILFIAALILPVVVAMGYMVRSQSRNARTDELVRLSREGGAVETWFDLCQQPLSTSPPSPNVPPELREQIEMQSRFVPSRRQCMGLVNSFHVGPGERPFLVYGAALTQSFRWTPFIGFGLALVVAISFAGADWSSGWIKTLLTWEVRRVRVAFARALAVVIGLLGLLLAALLLMSLTLAIATVLKGSFSGFDSVVVEDLFESFWRGLFLTALGGIIGYGLTTAFRYSLATPVVLFAYMGFEAALVSLSPTIRSWTLSSSLIVAGAGYDTKAFASVPVGRAGWLLIAASLLVLMGAVLTFAKRDITG